MLCQAKYCDSPVTRKCDMTMNVMGAIFRYYVYLCWTHSTAQLLELEGVSWEILVTSCEVVTEYGILEVREEYEMSS